MPMSPEERRRRERERKARYRAEQREKSTLQALPRIGAGGRDGGGTGDGDGSGTPRPEWSNEKAALDLIEMLKVPDSQKPRVALLLTFARDLDSPGAIAQRSSIAARYDETLDKLIAAAKPRERNELDEMRRKFYSGGVDAIADDPEAKPRATRKKA